MYSSKIPLYVQISDVMRKNIRTEKWEPGSKIPTEKELCNIFHVSRITVRKAIEELVNENLLEKYKPKGTFVTNYLDKKTENNYTFVKSFTEEMQEIGLDIETLDINVILIHADQRIAKYLSIEPTTPVIVLKRLRGVKGHAFAYFITYFKYEEHFSLKASNYSGSFYNYLNSLGIKISTIREVVEAKLPTREISQKLKITRNTPLLKRARFTSNSNNSFYEYTECYYIGSEYKYYIDFS